MVKYKNLCMLLGLYLIAAAGTAVYMLGVAADSNNQTIEQDNPGFNDYCQRPGLSNFDLSVCYGSMYVRPEEESSKSDDTKHKRLFLLYADGAPYAYYKSMLGDPMWKGRLVDVPSRVIGAISSAPIFRGASLGRIDGKFIQDMSMLDNIFGQIFKVAGIQFGLHTGYYYPVWHNLGNQSFARVDKVEQVDLEPFNSFCRIERDQGYIFMDHKETFGCQDFLDCSYPNLQVGAEAASKRSSELVTELKNCLP